MPKRPSEYESQLRQLRPFVRTGIRARKHFTPAQKGQITRLWNAHKRSVAAVQRGTLRFREMPASASARVGLPRRTNKGVFLPWDVFRSKVERNGTFVQYYKFNAEEHSQARKVTLVPLDKRDPEGQLRALFAAHPDAYFAYSIHGWEAKIKRGTEVFLHYTLPDSGLATGIYIVEPYGEEF